MNCVSSNFVEWASCFPHIKSLGQQITKKNLAIFPQRLSGLCFSLRCSWNNIETWRHCKYCWDFFTDRHHRNVSKAKQQILVTFVGEIWMSKEINPSYLIISVVVNFVSKHTMTCVFTVNEMLSLYSAARICVWFS